MEKTGILTTTIILFKVKYNSQEKLENGGLPTMVKLL